MRPDEHNDFRSRVIADCAALLPLARDACAAMETGDETKVLCLFCGESQRKTLRQLKRLIEDLRACRISEDLPGNCPEVIELRNASFKVFRGLTLRVGNPLNLTKRFRSGAVDFFRMLTKRDAILVSANGSATTANGDSSTRTSSSRTQASGNGDVATENRPCDVTFM